MKGFTLAAKVGAFTVAMLVAGFFIYRFVNKTAGSGSGYTVFVRMVDASGIAQRSQVRIAGIPIGSIESVKLEGERARITMRISKDVPIYEDASVVKSASSLLGEYYMAIAPGTEGRRKLQDGDEIRRVIEATTTDDILRQVASMAEKINRVAEALANSVGTQQGQENMRATLQNLAEVTDALNQTVRENRETIHNILSQVEGMTSRSAPEVDRILENTREVTENVRELVSKSEPGKQPDAGDVRQAAEKINRASGSLEKTLSNLEVVSGRLERGEGTLGKLTKDEKLINEVQGVAEDVGEFVGGLSRLQTIVSLRADFQFRSQAVKSFVELRLQPREDKYYSFEVVNDPRGSTRIEDTNVQTTNPNEPAQYREIRQVTTNTFRFSLQFAQRVGPLVGRFGIKESTGGVGLDLVLLDDRLELAQDLFGFGETVLPRWRVYLSYAFVKRLWLLGGADDILSYDRRDYFVGLNLRFNDEDLKSILPFAPKP
ncbi:MAG TPA: MlaD family protein [Polyangiaceae bacterium]|jgi:phospholipid/cholesterol/gamma-HCH transport system substrate-binding protein|nr:MlaD family protein [Polyangiaceae bacterium]